MLGIFQDSFTTRKNKNVELYCMLRVIYSTYILTQDLKQRRSRLQTVFFPLCFSSCIYVFSFQRAAPATVFESETKEKKNKKTKSSVVFGVFIGLGFCLFFCFWVCFLFFFSFLFCNSSSMGFLNRSN